MSVPALSTPTALPARDAAERANVHLNTLYTAIRGGELPARKVPGRGYAIEVADLDAWAARRATGQLSGLDAMDAAVRKLVAAAPPLSTHQIAAMAAEFEMGLRARAGSAR